MGILLKDSSEVANNVSMPGMAKAYYKDRAGNVSLMWSAAPPSGLTIGDLPVGALIKFMIDGAYWRHIVVQHGKPSTLYNDAFNDSAIFVRQDIWEKRSWSGSSYIYNSYANSVIHADLNSIYLNLIEERIRNIIKLVKIPYRPGNSGATVNGGENGLSTKAWLLSAYEVNLKSGSSFITADGTTLAYFIGATNATRIASLDGVATIWWLRSPFNNTNTRLAWAVAVAGGLSNGDTYSQTGYGMRPALALPANTPVSSVPDADGAYTILAA